MATWSPDNVILTEKGQQILSKVQAGVGAIKVTRIVTGGTIIPYAQLYKATSIPDIKQECTILSVSTDMKGSEISVSVSNENLEESYSLYTLGIYVTHPDFEGEQLYFVAECNTDNPDVIPLPSVTVATMYYSLYMVHENTSNVTINVSTAGSVTMDMVNKPGGVAGLDPSGKLSPDILPASVVQSGEDGKISESILPTSVVLKSTMVKHTLLSSAWVEGVYTFSNENITPTSPVELIPDPDITEEQLSSLQDANIIGVSGQASGSIPMKATGTQPSVDIPVVFIIRKDL